MIITLSNGKRVANFSSPHPFVFEDGSVLPAVDKLDAMELSIDVLEEEIGNGDIKLSFKIPPAVSSAIIGWLDIHAAGKVDVVFCPQMMMAALKEEMGEEWLLKTPFRTIRIVDRISKLLSITKQCI